MRINSILVLAGLLSLTAGSPDPPSPAQTTAASEALISYLEDLSSDSAFLSALSALEASPGAVASLCAFEASISSVFANRETLASDYLDAVPETVRPFFSSVYGAEASILSANGFKSPLSIAASTASTATGYLATSSSSARAAPRETGFGSVGRVAAAGALGFVGLVVAL